MPRHAWWSPAVFAARLPLLRRRQAVTAALRDYFTRHGFDEVETPILTVMPGAEVHLRAFATRLEDARGGAGQALYLHTSPELAMKKLLAAGLPRLFQFARVFRNAERSSTHHPEFTMLEWYRAGEGLEALMADCEHLLRAALAAAGQNTFRRGAVTCDAAGPFHRLSVAEAFQHHAGIDLLATAPDPLAPDAARLAAEARRIGLHVSPRDSWEDIFFRIALDRIEPHLGHDRPVFLHSWPASMAALAQRDPADPRVAQRFELYVCGVELANAFGELTDPAEQRRRFAADMAEKQRLYGEAWPVDEEFLAALEQGMPESAGIALGFDRLVMLATGAERIEDVLWAPVPGEGE